MYVNKYYETMTGTAYIPPMPAETLVWTSLSQGYQATEVLGKNPKFLQGEETDPTQVREMVMDILSAFDLCWLIE
jgi:hypothetical protein